MDPIYAGKYKMPILNKNTIKVALKGLEISNPQLKSSIKMIMFMMYVG